MKKRIVSSFAEPIGNIWKNLQAQYTKGGLFFVAAPLSSTPLPIYEWIVEHATEFENWDKVRFVLMDEMFEGEKPPFNYVSNSDSASYEGFAKKYLLEPIKNKIGTDIKIIKPEISDIENFDTEIDLLILAVGAKGNYANVMPGTPEKMGWHIAHLTEEFRQSHTEKGSQSYEGANFREYGMSLGHQQVLNAKNVLIIISGEKKRELAKELMSYDSFNPEFPLSIICEPKIKDRVEIYITNDVIA
ncbi:MAG TPA: 6-phosphogluconolactonase [Candidatus Paceibacterota bacterium]